MANNTFSVQKIDGRRARTDRRFDARYLPMLVLSHLKSLRNIDEDEVCSSQYGGECFQKDVDRWLPSAVLGNRRITNFLP